MDYASWADALTVIHLVYIAFVVGGQAAIVVGTLRRWQWVRNPWFRTAHLLAIGIVVFEAVFGINCLLTSWEFDLRGLAGQQPSEKSFLAQWSHRLMFHDWPPQWVFHGINIAFGMVVLVTFVIAPPHWRKFASASRAAQAAG